jgi:hypothetical protein
VRTSGNKNGFTKIDHVTYDVILPLLSTSAQSIFLRIYRQTFGWNKQADKISHGQFKTWCKIKRHETINKAIAELEAVEYLEETFCLITVEGKGTQIKEYGLNWAGIDGARQAYLMSLEENGEELST